MWRIGVAIVVGGWVAACGGAVFDRGPGCEHASVIDRIEGDLVVIIPPSGDPITQARRAFPGSVREGAVLVDGSVDEKCGSWWREAITRRRARLTRSGERTGLGDKPVPLVP